GIDDHLSRVRPAETGGIDVVAEVAERIARNFDRAAVRVRAVAVENLELGSGDVGDLHAAAQRNEEGMAVGEVHCGCLGVGYADDVQVVVGTAQSLADLGKSGNGEHQTGDHCESQSQTFH